MKTTTFEPSVCRPGEDGEPAAFSGEITIRLPGILDRCDLEERYAAAFGRFGKEEESVDNPDYLRTLTRFAAVEVASLFHASTLRRTSDGAEFKTWDDIDCERELTSVVHEALIMLVTGKRAVAGGAGGTSS